jgi:hypothetical protein
MSSSSSRNNKTGSSKMIKTIKNKLKNPETDYVYKEFKDKLKNNNENIDS